MKHLNNTHQSSNYQPKQKRAIERKERIMQAAMEMISKQGYPGATSKKIAAKAGVATGSFYRYFQDKRAVSVALIAHMEKEIEGGLFEHGERLRQDDHPERQVLAAMFRLAVTSHLQHKDFFREVLAIQLTDAELAAMHKEREARLIGDLAEFMRTKAECYRVKNFEAAARTVCYVIESISQKAMILDLIEGVEQKVSEAGDMVDRYLFN